MPPRPLLGAPGIRLDDWLAGQGLAPADDLRFASQQPGSPRLRSRTVEGASQCSRSRSRSSAGTRSYGAWTGSWARSRTARSRCFSRVKPGSGRLSLWKAGLAAAADRSYRVLSCRPIESEAELAYAALGDLLGRDLGDAIAELPEPQRRALEVALLLREPEGQQPLQRAVALATLGVLAVLVS